MNQNEENHNESINQENENVNNEEISLSDEDPEMDEPQRQKSHIPYKFQNRRLLQVAEELTDFKFKELFRMVKNYYTMQFKEGL